MVSKTNIAPPKFAELLLEWFIKDELVEEVLGDLDEKYNATLKTKTRIAAKLNYWYQVLNYLRPFAVKRLTSDSNNTDMLKNYFKIGFRNLRKNKGYSFINIGGLAFGITVALLISLWLHDELTYNTHIPNHDKIGLVIQNVNNNGETQTWTSTPFPLSEELRTNYSDNFENIVMAVSWTEHVLTLDDQTFNREGAYFEKGITDLLSLQMISGTGDFEDPTSVLLSESTARAIFKDKDPVNNTLVIGNMPPVKVTGVYQDLPKNTQFTGLDFIASWDFLKSNEPWFADFNDPWRPNFVSLYVELAENTSFESASVSIEDAKKKKIPEYLSQQNPKLFIHPMDNWHLYSKFKNGINIGGRIEYVHLFGTVAVFVLLLACINFINLNTARNESRAKEVGIRKAIGSVKKQLILQFLVESVLVVSFAYFISLLFASLLMPYFNELANKELTMPWVSSSFWALSTVFILIVALLAGGYPAFYLSSFKPVEVLKSITSGGGYSSLPRKVLVVCQFTVSISLIIGTITVYQQIQHAKDRPTGYSREGLVNVFLQNPTIHQHFDAIANELKQLDVVTSMAESQSVVTSVWATTSGLSWQGKDPDISTDFGMISSSYDYGKTIEWEIMEGRDFSRDFPSDSIALILNQSAINYMGLENPVGQQVTWWDNTFTIIGVVKDMIIESPYANQKPMIYFLSTGPGNVALLKLSPEKSVSTSITEIEAVFKKYDAEQPFEFTFVDDTYNQKFIDEARIGKLSTIFSILAIIICCLGIFGLASFMAERRAKEVGIRKILGASMLKLWQLLTQDFVFLVGIASAISFPLAYCFLKEWLDGFTYHISVSWKVFLLAAFLTLIITVITVSFQAIKAVMANPVSTLRSE